MARLRQTLEATPWGLRHALRQLLRHRQASGLQRRLRYLLARGFVVWRGHGKRRELELTPAGKAAARGRAC